MANYIAEYNGIKYVIPASNTQMARNVFMQILEAEDIIKLYKIDIKSKDNDNEKFIKIKNIKENTNVSLVKPTIAKFRIEDILAKRDGSCREYVGNKRRYYKVVKESEDDQREEATS